MPGFCKGYYGLVSCDLTFAINLGFFPSLGIKYTTTLTGDAMKSCEAVCQSFQVYYNSLESLRLVHTLLCNVLYVQ